MISTWARLCITNGIFLIVLISFSLRNNHRAEAATSFRHSGKSFIPSLAQDVKIAFASCMQQNFNISIWYELCTSIYLTSKKKWLPCSTLTHNRKTSACHLESGKDWTSAKTMTKAEFMNSKSSWGLFSESINFGEVSKKLACALSDVRLQVNFGIDLMDTKNGLQWYVMLVLNCNLHLSYCTTASHLRNEFYLRVDSSCASFK